MDDLNETFDYDYNETAVPDKLDAEAQEMNNLIYMYTGMYSITILLGVSLNILVIITLFRRIGNYEAAVWLLGMAISDLIFCLFLPFLIVSAWENFTWRFGWILCKLNSFVPFMSMYSTAFILSFMSLEQLFFNRLSCISCRFNASKLTLLISWFAAAVLSCPSLVYRVVQYKNNGEVCMDNYEYETTGLVTSEGLMRKRVVLYMRFIFGFILPVASAAICYCLLVLRKNSFQIKSSVNYHITKALVIGHCLCWLPCLCLPLWQHHSTTEISPIFAIIVPVSNALAAMSGCIKPVIYIFIGDSLCFPWMTDDYATTETELREMADKNDP
ncbi:chemerin-like receptor 2 [Brienomyrus brachyistius]|uniref:chemerin-like receptor 2 n=1 Tax=Brienomyrus brachyistius TaxID=42636 RepID=UPI0020B378C3|nr:chemerin-like receptor 2 [Brienomyrus brachyistius]XP_048855616.1 chemerin-like receptor 2 [Brienomyrus brachyistius]XP_048855618.1 chemerin-like receptor 2 [Brienomyrus brachyistius]XP_048855626.1 chemerin-like receptor 2 [Brienomyrus brachyistius]